MTKSKRALFFAFSLLALSLTGCASRAYNSAWVKSDEQRLPASEADDCSTDSGGKVHGACLSENPE